MLSTLSLPLLPGSLWPRAVAPDRVLSMSQIELCDSYANLNFLEIELFDHLTV